MIHLIQYSYMIFLVPILGLTVYYVFYFRRKPTEIKFDKNTLYVNNLIPKKLRFSRHPSTHYKSRFKKRLEKK